MLAIAAAEGSDEVVAGLGGGCCGDSDLELEESGPTDGAMERLSRILVLPSILLFPMSVEAAEM